MLVEREPHQAYHSPGPPHLKEAWPTLNQDWPMSYRRDNICGSVYGAT
jgi:hypothetical protein